MPNPKQFFLQHGLTHSDARSNRSEMLFIPLQPNASNLDAQKHEIVFVLSHESLPL
jgi:hypothetical protein